METRSHTAMSFPSNGKKELSFVCSENHIFVAATILLTCPSTLQSLKLWPFFGQLNKPTGKNSHKEVLDPENFETMLRFEMSLKITEVETAAN